MYFNQTKLVWTAVVVSQYYDTDVNKEYVIRGNSAILKCQIPSFVADFLAVVSWHSDQGDDIYPSNDYGKPVCLYPPQKYNKP